MQLFTGRVKFYDPQTDRGSIAPDGGGDEVPVDLLSSDGRRLSQGQKVSFRMIHRPDGIYACDIKLI
ncbi:MULTISPECIES: cold shock domain-containing protein [Pseudomonas]|uniref:cold-shock protein n=1 Tax=Pseudomonas TaxID=286 RepID=UPI001783B24C|nr:MULTISPECIES: cold shock domain-containing protein [Pseudomonas]MBD8237204.1 cold-shock protein [Pseudomonas fluorescens]MCM2360647.1 cold shock domain-containing protein [Pseudomonas sp. SR18]MDY0897674.1 cold shock domain-containing protein [Pseudomonas fluorescens]